MPQCTRIYMTSVINKLRNMCDFSKVKPSYLYNQIVLTSGKNKNIGSITSLISIFIKVCVAAQGVTLT